MAASGISTNHAFVATAASATDDAIDDTGSTAPSAFAGRRVAVYGVVINQGDTTASTVTFNSKGSGSGTAISPAFKATANGGLVLPTGSEPYFVTNEGEALSVTTGAGSTTKIFVVWKYV